MSARSLFFGMKAYLKNYRQSPRKVRLIADLLRGKSVSEARIVLGSTTKRSVEPLRKLLESAVANAKHKGNADPNLLSVKNISVNGGTPMKRFRPVSRGSAHPLKKRTSHILIELAEQKDEKEKIGKKKSKSVKTLNSRP